MNRIKTVLVVALCIAYHGSMADPIAPGNKARASAPEAKPTPVAAAIKVKPPQPGPGGLTSLPGVSKAKPGTYCCSTGSHPDGNGCAAHSILAVCAGSDYIRWECKADGTCTKVPFGGDN